jgi:hypothetical protein
VDDNKEEKDAKRTLAALTTLLPVSLDKPLQRERRKGGKARSGGTVEADFASSIFFSLSPHFPSS